ncbi:MAG: hypothetical protein QOH61_1549 [Chloroflexota bacterium]|jgi:outer membrane protein assembly factor BamB|nr:hypothetical protein [Chloroflexota bacterium]
MDGAARRRATVQYPGGLAARYRWTGSGEGVEAFGPTEVGGTLVDHGELVAVEPDRLCRAELRVEGPLGAWTARFASAIFDEPRGVYWDAAGLLVVAYGFVAYGLAGRTGDLAWTHRSGTPLVAVLASSRFEHVVIQSEVETVAVAADGTTVWRVAHSDVVAEVELVGGTLVLTSYGGVRQVLDPRTGLAPGGR